MPKFESLEEKQLSSQCIYDGKVLHVYKDDIELPDGSHGIREYCKNNGGVCVLPLTNDGEVILVEQYRYAHRRVILEIPAGKLEAGEDRDSAVLRELREETGHICKKITYLGQTYPSPALINEVIYIYFAEELEYVGQELDDDEFLNCKRIPLSTLVDMVCRGEVPDAKTQLATLKVGKLLSERQEKDS